MLSPNEVERFLNVHAYILASTRAPMSRLASRLYPGHMSASGSDELRPSSMLHRIGMSGAAAISVLVTLGVIQGMPGRSPAVIAVSAVSLIVAVSGMAWAVLSDSGIGSRLVALTAAGLD